MPRTPELQLHEHWKEEAQTQLKLKFGTQKSLLEALEEKDKQESPPGKTISKRPTTRQPISKFLNCRRIDAEYFKFICQELGLDPNEVIRPKTTGPIPGQPNIIEVLDIPKSTNPFGISGRITDPNDFYNREETLSIIFDRLAKGSSCSLVGESQIGKSSILLMVREYGPQQLPNVTFIYLDMQLISNENEFFTELCVELDIEDCRRMKLQSNLKVKNQRYVVCIDEIEKMININDFSGNERSELRGLAEGQSAYLTLVIASRTPLDQLFPDDPNKTSPLYGICQPAIYVEPFDMQTTRNFIQWRLQGNKISFTDEQINQLFSETNGHPGKLHQAAANLYRQLASIDPSQKPE